MSLIEIPPFSVFIGHGYVQHAGAGWSGSHNLRYHIYLIPDGHQLRDTVAFAYGYSFKKEGDASSEDEADVVIINKPTPIPEADDGPVLVHDDTDPEQTDNDVPTKDTKMAKNTRRTKRTHADDDASAIHVDLSKIRRG